MYVASLDVCHRDRRKRYTHHQKQAMTANGSISSVGSIFLEIQKRLVVNADDVVHRYGPVDRRGAASNLFPVQDCMPRSERPRQMSIILST